MNIFQKGDVNNFIQQSSSDKDFLQSEKWRKFQESVGHRTFNISGDNFRANIIEHKLLMVGKYFYIPRFQHATPKSCATGQAHNKKQTTIKNFKRIIKLAKKENTGWIRVDISNSRTLDLIRDHWRVIKAPHDMQPRQVFVIDITKNEEELLAQMKPKTRYNIRLSQRKNVSCIKYQVSSSGFNRAVNSFIKLVKVTSERNKIKSYPENYYRKMLEIIPEENLKLYAAEYKGEIIAANLVSFYGGMATYLHGASDNKYRNVMAPFLLQWRTMLDAKKAGCRRYDMGGVSTNYEFYETTNKNKKKLQVTSYKLQVDWAGITRFKLGFSPKTKPVEFPGSYDIVISPWKYWIYRAIQLIKSFVK